MKVKFGFLIWVWVLSCGNCLGRFVVEENSLKVLSPKWIQGFYDCAIANIGLPKYGGTLIGTVVYPTANRQACRSFNYFDFSDELNSGSLPIILLVDRGDCYFTLKAWNAQIAGVAAVLVDNMDEPLITMDTPDEEYPTEGYIQKISIPSALITKPLGDNIKQALARGETVVLNLDWTESFPRGLESSKRVLEYEFWTDSNYECGSSCHGRLDFIINFKETARKLEQEGHTRFTPHYLTWYCPEAFLSSKLCRSQCIRRGRYCAIDDRTMVGYDGKDVVVQNLRQACVFEVAKQIGKPWLWWDYVTDFALSCTMRDYKFTKDCADQVIRSLGVDVATIDDCIGDTDADVDHPILKAEQNAQIGEGNRRDVTMLPTLMINNKQYRGKLHKTAVLNAICADFQETNAKPSICLSEDVESNEHVVLKDWW